MHGYFKTKSKKKWRKLLTKNITSKLARIKKMLTTHLLRGNGNGKQKKEKSKNDGGEKCIK